MTEREQAAPKPSKAEQQVQQARQRAAQAQQEADDQLLRASRAEREAIREAQSQDRDVLTSTMPGENTTGYYGLGRQQIESLTNPDSRRRALGLYLEAQELTPEREAALKMEAYGITAHPQDENAAKRRYVGLQATTT